MVALEAVKEELTLQELAERVPSPPKPDQRLEEEAF
jgi:hypothetical protein